MHFDFTEDQYALRDGARAFFAGECTPADVRAQWDDGAEADEARWQRWRAMAETGFIGLRTSEEHGGLGMDEVDLVLLLEEAGRAALPEPLVETTAVAAPWIAEAGTDEQRQTWLPAITAGETIAAVQLPGDGLVVDAHLADLLLLVRDGVTHAVPREDFHATAQPSLDGARRVFTVEAETGEGTAMPHGHSTAERAADRASWATSAVLCGLSQHLLETTVAYVGERQQFGRPVGSFQAVKHKLAETMLVVETSRAAVWYAAYAIAHDLPDRSQAVSVAKSYASDAAAKANHEALQCHGGIGFTWEHDLHLWLKRAKALEVAYGSARHHRERLAAHLFAA